MTGKEKCQILKKIRAEIAADNGIQGFEYKECEHVGDCNGTCPACDAEVALLNEFLQQRGISVDVFANQKNMLDYLNNKHESVSQHSDDASHIIEENYGKPTLTGMGDDGMRLLLDFEASGKKGIAYLIDESGSSIQRIDINMRKKKSNRNNILPGYLMNRNVRGDIGMTLPNHKSTLVVITEIPEKKRRGIFGLFKNKTN